MMTSAVDMHLQLLTFSVDNPFLLLFLTLVVDFGPNRYQKCIHAIAQGHQILTLAAD